MAKEKVIVGRHEFVAFPELDLFKVSAKVDTGAYTSSLHCNAIEETEEGILCQFSEPFFGETPKEYLFESYKERRVKSSNGIVERRYSVKTQIELLGKIYSIELTLTDRSLMKHPILIGRKFLNKKIIVDVSRKYQG